MPTFNQLSQSDSVNASDQIPIYSNGQGDLRRTSISAIFDYVQDSLDASTDTTVYGITTAGTTFSVALQPAAPGQGLWARLDPSATATVGTFVLPNIDYRADAQEILVTSTQSISSVVFVLSGATIVGSPTSMAAGGFFRLRYDAISNSWNRVG